jgi:hypothetical protein
MADPFDYLESRDDADELIQEFGQAVQIIRDVESGPDYAPVLTPTPFDTFAAQVEFTLKQMQSGWVREGAERWIVAAGPLAAAGVTEVVPDNRISVGGVERKILVAKPLAPAGIVVMFDCQVAT